MNRFLLVFGGAGVCLILAAATLLAGVARDHVFAAIATPVPAQDAETTKPAAAAHETHAQPDKPLPRLVRGRLYQTGRSLSIYAEPLWTGIDPAQVYTETLPEDGVFRYEETLEYQGESWHGITVNNGLRHYRMFVAATSLESSGTDIYYTEQQRRFREMWEQRLAARRAQQNAENVALAEAEAANTPKQVNGWMLAVLAGIMIAAGGLTALSLLMVRRAQETWDTDFEPGSNRPDSRKPRT